MDRNSLEYKALRIRAVEERISREYYKQNMSTPIHLCSGQEEICVAVCEHLRPNDLMFAYYRSHGWYLAKGGNLNRMIAELYGKPSGCSGGKGRSMHLIDLSVGFHGTSAIVGGGIPHAVGAALALKMKGEKERIVVSVFGDGATEQGVFWESINYADVERLPILFVCINDGLAVNVPSGYRQRGGTTIFERVGLPGFRIEENDSLLDKLSQTNILMRILRGPCFLEIETTRSCPHVGPLPLDTKWADVPPEIEAEVCDAFQFAWNS